MKQFGYFKTYKNQCKWKLEQPYLRLFLYRKIVAMSYSADYFQLNNECKQLVDKFYVDEELYADKLELIPDYLLQMRQAGVFPWKTRELGIKLYHKLRLLSHEQRTVYFNLIVEDDIKPKFLWFDI